MNYTVKKERHLMESQIIQTNFKYYCYWVYTPLINRDLLYWAEIVENCTSIPEILEVNSIKTKNEAATEV